MQHANKYTIPHTVIPVIFINAVFNQINLLPPPSPLNLSTLLPHHSPPSPHLISCFLALLLSPHLLNPSPLTPHPSTLTPHPSSLIHTNSCCQELKYSFEPDLKQRATIEVRESVVAAAGLDVRESAAAAADLSRG